MNYNSAAFEACAGLKNQFIPSTLPEMVFSGRSNVGKSSLINKIVNRKALARTSSSPGKTATINFYKLDFCRLVDLPGYGFARVSMSEKKRWSELINGYFEDGRNIKLVVQIVDMRHELSKDDCDMIDFLTDSGLPFIIVCTKSDKLNKTEYNQMSAYFTELFTDNGYLWLPVSSQNGENIDKVREVIEKHAAL